MSREITFKGKPYTLVGRALKVGSRAPEFKAVAKDLNDITLEDFDNKIKVITSFLSLDTSVCEAQLKEFNQRASGLSKDIVVIAVSKDLPFAQKRFCEMEGIDRAVVLSDYKYSSFGINYGVTIKEMNLLSRSIFIIDKSNVTRYIQLVKENSQHPDYEQAFKALNDVTGSPSKQMRSDIPETCKPCEGKVPALDKEKISSLLNKLGGWGLIEGNRITKDFKFKDFVEAKYFVDLIAVIAEQQKHHPLIKLDYNKLNITLWTHAAKGLTENDFIMAKAIDGLD